MFVSYPADGIRCYAAQSASAVVCKAQGAGANARGKQFAANDPRAGEEACAKEADKRDQKSGGTHQAEAASAARDRQSQIGWHPAEQPPPREQSKDIQQQQKNSVPAQGRGKNFREWSFAGGAVSLLLPHFGFGNAFSDPERYQG